MQKSVDGSGYIIFIDENMCNAMCMMWFREPNAILKNSAAGSIASIAGKSVSVLIGMSARTIWSGKYEYKMHVWNENMNIGPKNGRERTLPINLPKRKKENKIGNEAAVYEGDPSGNHSMYPKSCPLWRKRRVGIQISVSRNRIDNCKKPGKKRVSLHLLLSRSEKNMKNQRLKLISFLHERFLKMWQIRLFVSEFIKK